MGINDSNDDIADPNAIILGEEIFLVTLFQKTGDIILARPTMDNITPMFSEP